MGVGQPAAAGPAVEVGLAVLLPLPWAQALYELTAHVVMRSESMQQLADYLGVPLECAAALHECSMHLADELHFRGVRGW